MRHIIITAVISATIALTTGCTASPAENPDAVAPLTAECWTLRAPIEDLDAALTEAMATLFDDATASATLLTDGVWPFADATRVLEDAQLREAAEPVGDAVNRLAEAMTAYGSDPSEQNAAAVLDINTEVTDHLALVGTICDDA